MCRSPSQARCRPRAMPDRGQPYRHRAHRRPCRTSKIRPIRAGTSPFTSRPGYSLRLPTGVSYIVVPATSATVAKRLVGCPARKTLGMPMPHSAASRVATSSDRRRSALLQRTLNGEAIRPWAEAMLMMRLPRYKQDALHFTQHSARCVERRREVVLQDRRWNPGRSDRQIRFKWKLGVR